MADEGLGLWARGGRASGNSGLLLSRVVRHGATTYPNVAARNAFSARGALLCRDDGRYNRRVRVVALVMTVSVLSGCRPREPIEAVAVPSGPVVAGESPGPSPLRRLTKQQYENTLRDVFDVEVAEHLPDEAVVGGFEGAAEAQLPSELFVSRAQRSAQRYAEAVVSDPARLRRALQCDDWTQASSQARCLARFFQTTARRLYRRALTEDELARLSADVAKWTSDLDFVGAVQLLLEQMLQAPAFLYRPEPGPRLDGFQLATRLSFLLWDSGPDEALLERAQAGALTTREDVRAEASRMLADPRARRTMWSFHRQWLGLERLMLEEHAVRTPEVDPQWTALTPLAAQDETRRFVEAVMTEEGTLGALLMSRRAWLDAETARLYGVTSVGETVLDSTRRAGVLTRVAFLASTAHRGATSPPIRGNAINLKLLCRMPTPPPPGIDTTPPSKPAGQKRTTRELFEDRTRPTSCAGCHHALNGLGFGFEHYDAAGHWRALEDGLAIDATGETPALEGSFDGAIELSSRLASSREVQRCATSMWARYALGRAPVPVEEPWLNATAERFVQSDGDVKGLLLDLVSSPSFLALPVATP